MAERLPRSFYARETIEVARELLGQRLVHRLPDGTRLSGRIVETEAYLGLEDPACHSFGDRRTARTEVMYGEPGLSYVYFVYGMHFCFNAITMVKGVPEAVLVRALQLKEGVARVQGSRPHAPVDQLANGPGKLCRALQLDRRHNAIDLTTSNILFVEQDVSAEEGYIVEGPRIGIGYAQDAVHWPLRFGIRHHPALSPTKFLNYEE